jgi:diguanylate cyclase (GGDEF)-like protein
MPAPAVERDPVTGLCTRRTLQRRLERRLDALGAEGVPGALILCDLEMFGAIVERYGTAAGEAALRLAAEAIRSAVRAIDTVARIEGGRFAVLLGRIPADQALAIAARISTAVRSRRLKWQDASVPIAVSVGIASYASGEEAAALLARHSGDTAVPG